MSGSSHHQVISDLIETDLTIGDQISFLVTSNSMQPIMNIGDTVVAEIISGTDVNHGDVIVIKRVDSFLTHRAISPSNEGWLTKGDNNIQYDPPVMPESIIGRVQLVQKTHQRLNFGNRKWLYLNPLLAKLGYLETRTYLHRRFFRLPFRTITRLIQKVSILPNG